MISHTAFDTLRRLARGFPVVALTGPRQSGTTLAADWLSAARKWQSLAGEEAAPPVVVFGATETTNAKGAESSVGGS